MRKLYSLLVVLLVSLAARGTHMSGGEIYWEHLGGNQYRITLTIYRDCAGIQLDNNYDLDITSPCGSTTLHVTTPGGVELSQLCDLQLPNSTCNGGSLPGIQQYVYTGVVNLPPCDSWTISWTEIYRNNAIVNLQAPGTLEMYIEGVLNNAEGPANDSPQFTNTAIPYICLGYPISYSYGAFDPEGDSLSYEFIGARVGGANPIAYVPPFTGAEPITGITLDPATGLVNFTLNQAGNWVVVVQVNEYDSLGNLIGTIMRDMQFVAYPCSNVPPDASTGTVTNMSGGAVQTAPYAVQVCESGDFCFDMVISDANTNNVLEATTNITNNLPGATFSYTGTNPITCHVCWNAGPGTAGFYPFIVNVNDGACPIVAFQTYVYAIEVIEGLFVDVVTTDETCAGMNDGTATVDIVAGTGPYQYNWGTIGALTPSITAGAGSYPVQVIDANGCVAAPETAIINTTQPPTANAGNDATVCYGAWPVALSGTATNAQSTTWSGGSGTWSGTGSNMFYTPSAAEISAGGADVVFNANANGSCPDATDALHINISNSFLNSAIVPDNANCNGSADGSASFTPDIPGNTYLWNTAPPQSGATATGLAAGSYSVTATDALGCTTTLSTTVSQPSSVSLIGITPVNETCAGMGNGSLTAAASGGTPPYAFVWNTGATTATLVAGAGTYNVNVSDANGCTTAPGSGTINTTQPPTANAGNDVIACYGTWPISLSGAGTNAQATGWSGGNGLWNGSGATMQYTPSAAEITAGGVDVIFTATGNSTCPDANDLLHVSLSDLPVNAAVTSNDAGCNGGSDGSATFTPNSTGNTYLWSTTPPQTSPMASGLAAGNYSLTVTDLLGCSMTLNTTIGQPQALVITGLNPVNESCAGSGNGSLNAMVTGGTAPYSYSWSNGATTSAITVGAGSYTVNVTDVNGCTPVTATATVGSTAQPNSANAGPDQVVCMNDYPIAITGTVMNATGGTWSGGTGSIWGNGLSMLYTPSAAEIAAGSADITLTTTGNTGCPPATDNVHLTLSNSFLNAGISGTSVLCAGGNTGTATFIPSLPSLSYQWSPSGQTAPTATGLPAGTHSVTVTDLLGCDTTMSVVINQPPPLVLAGMQANDPLCAGSSNGSATVLVNGGTPGYTYQWSANAGAQTAQTASGLGAGNYVVVVTDAQGCTAQGTAALTAPAPIVLTAHVPDTVCVNAPTQLTAQASGGDGDLTINWSGIGTGPSLLYSFPASQTVTVTASDGSGCSGPVLAFPVAVLDLTTAALSTYGDTAVCAGGVAHVGAQVVNYPGTVTYQWTELQTTGAGPHAVPVDYTQTLHVSATNICGQTLMGTVDLVLETPPLITLPPLMGQGCAPLTVQFPDSLTDQNVTWLWNLGDGNTSTAPAPVHTYGEGSYTISLTVTTPAGCTANALNTSSVVAYPSPTAAFTASTYSTDMDSPTVEFTNASTGNINGYLWQFGDGDTSATDNPTHTFTDVGDFVVQLTVTDVNGCTDMASATIQTLPIYDIDIPNAFTPNPNGGGGGIYDPTDLSNDVFYPFVRFVKDFKMRIWNRWGELVFESNELNRGWDGWYKGQLSPQDVYVYRAWFRFVDDREAEKMGDLTLFR